MMAIELMEWLNSQEIYPKIFWCNRDKSFLSAAVGSVRSYTSLPRHPSKRLYGWRPFLPNKNNTEWDAFSKPLYIQPQEEYTIQDKTSLFSRLKRKLIPTQTFSILSEIMTPSIACWKKAVKNFLSDFPLDKVVFARKCSLQNQSIIQPLSLLKKLYEESQNAYIFYFQISPNCAFLGASPEILFRRKGSFISSDAIAGTKPRGSTPTEDTVLRKELESSEKERREFFFVEHFVNQTLRPFCIAPPALSSISVLQTPSVQHLYRSFTGTLKKNMADRDLIEALHPTPAVAGWPCEEALRCITATEAFDRGLYAAPVGWIDARGSEWAVGIRSALVSNDMIHLYSGAGIVEGSQGENEWQELDQKLSLFRKILNN